MKILSAFFVGLLLLVTISGSWLYAQEDVPEEETVLTDEETFGVPLPVVGANPNTDVTVGALLAVVSESEGKLTSIMVPIAFYNEFYGYEAQFHFFGFPSETVAYNYKVSHTTESFWDYQFEYKQQNFFNDSFTFHNRSQFERSPSERFHGIGADSEEDDETSFTFKKAVTDFTVRTQLADHLFASISLRFRWAKPGNGIVDDVPSIEDLFPNEEGVGESNYTLPIAFSLEYDTRDSIITPSTGMFGKIFLEVGDEHLLSSFSFQRYGVEGRVYLPVDDEGRLVTAVRGLFEVLTGEDIPFYEHSSLGGHQTLRGFGEGRFYDNNRILLNFEGRIRLFRWLVGDISLDIENALFTDIGQVWNSFGEIGSDLQVVVGFGVRFVVRSQIVAKVDMGYGEEGSAVFAGLDYPF